MPKLEERATSDGFVFNMHRGDHLLVNAKVTLEMLTIGLCAIDLREKPMSCEEEGLLTAFVDTRDYIMGLEGRHYRVNAKVRKLDLCSVGVEGMLTPLMPPKLGCHPLHDTKGAGTKICKCSSEINMKSASAQIIPMKASRPQCWFRQLMTTHNYHD
jgi:hypothetical protein